MNSGLKTVLKFAAAGIFFIICAVLPSLFTSSNEVFTLPPAYPLDYYDRSTIYSAYAAERIPAVQISPEELNQSSLEQCNAKLVFLLDYLILDENLYTNDDNYTVQEFYSVTDERGREIRLMKYYSSRHGDWTSWIYLMMDVDTQDIYFLYISADCESDFFRYNTMEIPDLESIKEFLSISTGYSMATTHSEGFDGDRRFAYLSFGNGENPNPYYYKAVGHTAINADTQRLIYDYNIYCQERPPEIVVLSDLTKPLQ